MVGLERGTVELQPHDPAWRERYEAEVDRLQSIAGDRLLEFEHVGSTAVEGLAAKPIIDMLAVVDDLEAADDLRSVLEANEYEYRPNDPVPDRRFFAKGPRSNRTHYLSLVERGSETFIESIAFRDYLRENPDTAADYEALKRELADRYPGDRASYTEAKGAFVEDVLERAFDGETSEL